MSEPAIAQPASSPIGFYSELAMAEVIAGCERTFALWRGKASSCNERVRGLETRIVELTDLAKRLNLWSWLAPVLSAGVALVLGAAAGFALGFGLRVVPQ